MTCACACAVPNTAPSPAVFEVIVISHGIDNNCKTVSFRPRDAKGSGT